MTSRSAILLLAASLSALPAAPDATWAQATEEVEAPAVGELSESQEQLAVEAEQLEAEERWREAAAVAEKLLADLRANQGEAALEVIEAIEWIAELNEEADDWQASITWREKALAWRQAHESPAWQTADAERFLAFSKQVVALPKEQYGKLEQAYELWIQAVAHYEEGDLEQAIKVGNQALDVQKEVLGDTHFRHVLMLGELAGVAYESGDSDLSVKTYRQALKIAEQTLGGEHPTFGDLLHSLADVYEVLGERLEAETLYKRAIAVREKTLGADDPDLALSLNNLGFLYGQHEEYAQAEPLFRRAIEIFRSAYGEQDIELANALWNLADLLSVTNRIAEALSLYEQSIKIQREFPETDTQAVLTQVQEMAGTLENSFNYIGAAKLRRLAVVLHEDLQDTASAGYGLNLAKLAFALFKQANYTDAEPLYLKAIEVQTKALGPQNLYLSTTLNDLGLLYSTTARFAEAKERYEAALAIRKQSLGENHPYYALTLGNLALLHQNRGNYDEAEPLYKKVLEIREKTSGPKSPQFALILNNLGFFYYEKSDYTQAEAYYKRSISVRELAQGPNHPELATTLMNLGNIYLNQGEFARTEPIFQRALDIAKSNYGDSHTTYAACLQRFGELYFKTGDYSRSEECFQKALAIYEAAYGPNNPTNGIIISGLATVYETQGDYSAAEPLKQRALELTRRAFGEKHPRYAMRLNDLALFYGRTGDLDRAEALLTQARQITEESVGADHPNAMVQLNNLAWVYRVSGDTARAERIYRIVAASIEDNLGPQSPVLSTALNNLAESLSALRKYDEAIEIYHRVLRLQENSVGAEHASYALTLSNLAQAHFWSGRVDEAQELAERALQIMRSAYGGDHPEVAMLTTNAAFVSVLKGDAQRGERLMGEASAAYIRHLQRTFSVQSERQKLLMLRKARHNLDSYISVALDSGAEPAEVYAQVLAWKGVVFADQLRQRLMRGESGFAEEFKELTAVSRRLAAASLMTPGDSEQKERRTQQIEELTAEKERIERELARRSGEFNTRRALSRVAPSDIAASLPSCVALIDYLAFTRFTVDNFKQIGRAAPTHLVAFVVRPGGEITMIELGPAAPIEKLIADWRGKRQYAVALLGQSHPGHELKRKLWDPITPTLGDATCLLFSPDGALCRFPFAALPGKEEETFLIEDYAVATAPAPQLIPKLTEQASAEKNENPSLLLVGAVDYGDPASESKAPVESVASLDRGGVLGELSRSGSLPTYQPLPGTRAEVEKLRQSFSHRFPEGAIENLTGRGATEDAFRKSAPVSAYVHLATHGFFAPARLKSALAPEPPESLFRDSGVGRRGVAAFHPGLLSGVVFAGANNPALLAPDDGVLTALEVSSLDLQKVELAVLSACETGLGEAAGGEGVLGLQRSFQLAGAKTVVSTLWQVPDRQTSLLMQKFYANVWQGELSRVEAMRQAQVWMLKGGDDGERFEVPPEDWAAFTISGQWQ